MGKIIDIAEALLDLGLSSSVTETERAVVQAAVTRAEAAVRRFLHYDPTRQERTEFYPQQQVGALGQEIWEVNDTVAYTRTMASEATSVMVVRHLPVRSVAHLYIDYDGRSGARTGSFGAGTEKTEGDDYWPNYDLVDSAGAKVCSDGILRSIGQWPTTPGSVKIVYTAGYTDAELHGADSVIDASPIVEAVVEETVRRATRAFQMAKKSGSGFGGPFTSESLGDYSYSRDASITKEVFGLDDLLARSVSRLTGFVNLGYAIGG